MSAFTIRSGSELWLVWELRLRLHPNFQLSELCDSWTLMFVQKWHFVIVFLYNWELLIEKSRQETYWKKKCEWCLSVQRESGGVLHWGHRAPVLWSALLSALPPSWCFSQGKRPKVNISNTCQKSTTLTSTHILHAESKRWPPRYISKATCRNLTT